MRASCTIRDEAGFTCRFVAAEKSGFFDEYGIICCILPSVEPPKLPGRCSLAAQRLVSVWRKGFSVASLLSVLLPVQNVQETLVATVVEILEVISECTKDFELLIIDDGSTDATSEVAMELTRAYPQIRVVCHGRSQGRESALRRGLQLSRGEMILTHEEVGGTPLEEFARRWKTSGLSTWFYRRDRSSHPVAAFEESAPGKSPSVGTMHFEGIHALSREGVPRVSRKSGFCLVDRRARDTLPAFHHAARPKFLEPKGQFSAEGC